MRYAHLFVIIGALYALCVHSYAQNPPPTRASIEAAGDKVEQKRTAIRTLGERIGALLHSADLLSRDSDGQTDLAIIKSILAEAQQQLAVAKKDYESAAEVWEGMLKERDLEVQELIKAQKNAEASKSHP